MKHLIDNPIDGILPDFYFLGAKFTALWQKLLAGIWGIGIILAIVFLIWGFVQMGKSDDGNPNAYKIGRKAVIVASISLGCLAALAVIVGAILALVGG